MSAIPEHCLPFDEDLSAWLDGELDVAREAAVRAHADACPRCTARLTALRSVDDALRGLASARPQPRLASRMAERLAAERRRTDAPLGARGPVAPRRRRAWVGGLVAAAAACALGLLVVSKLFAPDRPRPHSTVAQHEPTKAIPQGPAATAPRTRIASAEAQPPAIAEPAQRHFGASAADAPQAAGAPDAALAQLRSASDDDLALAAALQDAGGVESPEDLSLVERLDEVESLGPLDSGGRG